MESRCIVVLRGNTRHSSLYNLHHSMEPAVIVQRVCGEQRGVAGACAFIGVAYTWCLDYYCVTIYLCCPIFELNIISVSCYSKTNKNLHKDLIYNSNVESFLRNTDTDLFE